MENEQLIAELNSALDLQYVRRRPDGMDYVDHYYVVKRMNTLFGIGGWTCECVNLLTMPQGKKTIAVATVRVTVPKLGFDTTDVGEDDKCNYKSAMTDGMKRACRLLGDTFGLALVDKDRNNVMASVPTEHINAATSVDELKLIGKEKVAPLRVPFPAVYEAAKEALRKRSKELENG